MTHKLQQILNELIAEDSGPEGSTLFDIHYGEFATSYLQTILVVLQHLKSLDDKTIGAVQARIEESDGACLNPWIIENIVRFTVEELTKDVK